MLSPPADPPELVFGQLGAVFLTRLDRLILVGSGLVIAALIGLLHGRLLDIDRR